MTPRAKSGSFVPAPDPDWRLDRPPFDPLRESSRQSRFALSNGFIGVRGGHAFSHFAHPIGPSETLIAGFFDTANTPEAQPRLIPAPDWLNVQLKLNELTGDNEAVHVLDAVTSLDLRRGWLLTEGHIASDDAVLQFQELRLVSARQPALGLQIIRLVIDAGKPFVRLSAAIGWADPALNDFDEPGVSAWRTHRSARRLVMATSASLAVDETIVVPAYDDHHAYSWKWRGHPGQVAEFVRLVAFGRCEAERADPAFGANAELTAAIQIGWTGVVDQHVSEWSERWASCDIQIDGDPAAQQAVRFAAYHLNSAANPTDESVSIPARGLTGDDYAGHVFWDTEIFLLPFYCLTWPDAARSLLMYRFHMLDGARDKAKRLGWQGALYAWESADTGADVTPPHSVAPDRQVTDILCGTQEQHVSADVAYAVWRYWTITGDESFMRDAGAEILIETARFWVSRAVLEDDGLRHVRGVIGPDEYHETVDDNAFTNVMARWNIERGFEVVELVGRLWPDRWNQLCARLGLTDAELSDWPAAARSIATGLDVQTGLFEQFEGYSELEPIDLAAYSGRSVPMDVVLGRARTSASQVIKQADVVALLALLPEAFADGSAAANFAWYEPRCSHGSSLSTAMHGLVAARLGFADKALDYFRRTAAIDLCDDKAAIGGGVHMAALGGVWMTAVLGFAGVAFREDGVSFKPQLPDTWTAMRFPLQWRGRRLEIEIKPSEGCIHILVTSGEAMAAYAGGARYWLEPGQRLRIEKPDQTMPARA